MESSPPRCYILDEAYRLVLACSNSPDDPLNNLYEAGSTPDALPEGVEGVVRALTRRWERESDPVVISARVKGLRLMLAPLHGSAGRHIAVFVDSDSIDPPLADWRRDAVA